MHATSPSSTQARPQNLSRHSKPILTVSLLTLLAALLAARILPLPNLFTMPRHAWLRTTDVDDPPISTLPDTSKSTTTPLPTTFTDSLPLPRVLVFDLDYTLWPFWTDTHPSPPLRPADSAGTSARDAHNSRFAFYAHVPSVLSAARARGLLLATASRTTAVDVAEGLLRALQVEDPTAGSRVSARRVFASVQIYPGSKVKHLERIRRETGVGFEEMLFFDDESRNLDVERQLGVCTAIVRDGVTREEVDKGVLKWRKVRGKSGKEGGDAEGL